MSLSVLQTFAASHPLSTEPLKHSRSTVVVDTTSQSVGHLTRKSGVLGSILGLATLSFHLSLFQEGQLSVTGEGMCTKYWLTA